MAPGEEFTNVTRGATNLFFFFLLKSRKMLAVCVLSEVMIVIDFLIHKPSLQHEYSI